MAEQRPIIIRRNSRSKKVDRRDSKRTGRNGIEEEAIIKVHLAVHNRDHPNRFAYIPVQARFFTLCVARSPEFQRRQIFPTVSSLCNSISESQEITVTPCITEPLWSFSHHRRPTVHHAIAGAEPNHRPCISTHRMVWILVRVSKSGFLHCTHLHRYIQVP